MNVSENDNRPKGSFKLSWEDSKKIFNNTWNQTEKPVEIFRTDFISAMKVPDHQVLTDAYLKIQDSWKQEYDKGVQVPVDVESLPEPEFHVIKQVNNINHRPWTLPRKYICQAPEENILDQVSNNEIPDPCYDMDDADVEFLNNLNSIEDTENKLTELKFELIVTYLDSICHLNMMKHYQSTSSYSIQHDESVYCEICKDIYSEPDNEMIFCDNCNICVHQGCYGITSIPEGEWYCSPCKSGCFSPVCLLCMQPDGAFKASKNGEWIHIFCALWIPEVGFGNVEKMEPINKIKQIPSLRWSLLCCFCQERIGVCIQCSIKDCYVPFHPTCAYENKCHMQTIYGTEENPNHVENICYCSKHSASKIKTNPAKNVITLLNHSKGALNPLYNEQSKILNDIQLDFFTHVDVLDVSVALDINLSSIQLVFDYWKEKRLLNGNNPLIDLPSLSKLAAKAPNNVEIQENTDFDPFLKLVSLRQDLERARVLVHMTERRERLKKRLLKGTLSIVEACFQSNKPLPFKCFRHEKLQQPIIDKLNNSQNDIFSFSDDGGSLNLSQSSLSKVIFSPTSHVSPDMSTNTTRNKYIANDSKEDTDLIVAQEIVLQNSDHILSGSNVESDSKDGDHFSYKYHSSEDPEWKCEAEPKSKKRSKKGTGNKSCRKMKDLTSEFYNKVIIDISEKSDVQSSQDELSHYTTPPTSPEYEVNRSLTKNTTSVSDPQKRKHEKTDSEEENNIVLANACTPPSPNSRVDNIPSRTFRQYSRKSKRFKPTI